MVRPHPSNPVREPMLPIINEFQQEEESDCAPECIHGDVEKSEFHEEIIYSG